MLPLIPRLNRLDEKSRAEGPQFGVGRVRHAKPGQDASATTEDQQAASGGKKVTLCFNIPSHHVIED